MSFADILESIPLAEVDDDFAFARRALDAIAGYLGEHPGAEWITCTEFVERYNATAPVRLHSQVVGRRLAAMSIRSENRNGAAKYRTDAPGWARLELACDRYTGTKAGL